MSRVYNSPAALYSRVTFISKKRGKQNSIFLILSVYCTQIVSFLWLWCLVLTKYLHLDKWHKISLKKTMISQENYFLLIKILSYWRFCPNYFLIFDHFWSFWHYAWKSEQIGNPVVCSFYWWFTPYSKTWALNLLWCWYLSKRPSI